MVAAEIVVVQSLAGVSTVPMVAHVDVLGVVIMVVPVVLDAVPVVVIAVLRMTTKKVGVEPLVAVVVVAGHSIANNILQIPATQRSHKQ